MINLYSKTLIHSALTAGIFAMVLVFGFALYACNNGNSTSSGSGGGGTHSTDSGGGMSGETASIVTYRNDNGRTGQNLQETILTPANVNPTKFGKLFSYPVDGQVYGQPLYLPNLNINGQIHNVVFVATMHDSVYAFDANNPGASASPLWQTNFGNSVPVSDYGCPDAGSEVGILSTPVIDPNAGTLYVVATTKENGGYVYRVHALSITTGDDKIAPVEVAATLAGTGDGTDNGFVSFDALQHWQRSALLLSNGVLYVGFGSHCDDFPYHGWLFAYDAKTLNQIAVFNDTLNGSDGGIWNGGPSADADGNLFMITGNGTFDGSATVANNINWGDTFLKMTGGLTVLDFFTPFNQQFLSDEDLDLGSSAPVLLPDQAVGPPHLLVGAGKEGTIYLLNRDNMGQFNPKDDSQIVQETAGQFSGLLWSTPAYFNNTLYFVAFKDVIKAFSLENGRLNSPPSSQGTMPYPYPGASPSVSANGSSNGIVWTIAHGSSAVLHAYAADNVSNELYNSNMDVSGRDVLGDAVTFAIPTVANGKVYVGTQTELAVFGLLP